MVDFKRDLERQVGVNQANQAKLNYEQLAYVK